ncbi:Fc receptor-like protein 4 [Lemur catta]|uniref:Fc receptor-like protein 4 n=1 Tax=Lemur catta TaxID=9447 RepID=UPI001E26C449|nr:Fc receptor-like protein 4 [Lemur catta]
MPLSPRRSCCSAESPVCRWRPPHRCFGHPCGELLGAAGCHPAGASRDYGPLTHTLLQFLSLLVSRSVLWTQTVSLTLLPNGDKTTNHCGWDGSHLRLTCISPLLSATAHKPVISLHPPWTTVFQGERVNLTCNGFHYSPQTTKWKCSYLGKEIVRDTPGDTFEVRESGEYRCQIGESTLSNPVRLVFSTEPLILQAPYSVFEGDTLVLRCQRRGKKKLTAVKYIWNGKTLSISNESQDLLIPQASSNNNGSYQCIGTEDKNYVFRSNSKMIKIQELFPHPKLKATVSQPTEGNSVNLSCETQLPPERSDTPLYFIFFRDDGVVLSDQSKSPELQIPTIWRENSGSYWCGAETVSGSVHKRSLPLQIQVQRIPVSGVFMETQPPGDQVVEGEVLVFVCSVAEGTGDTMFSWHREDMKESLGRKTQRSQRAELEVPVIRESHAGRYYCAADNSYGPVQSGVVNVTVRGTSGNRDGVVAAGATGGLLSTLLAMALLFSCWHWRKSGEGFRGNETRSPPTAGPGESSHSICPVQVELQPVYGNGEDSPVGSFSWPQPRKETVLGNAPGPPMVSQIQIFPINNYSIVCPEKVEGMLGKGHLQHVIY